MSASVMLSVVIVILLYVLNITECKKTASKIGVGEFWWGPEDLRRQNDSSIRPFHIVFDEYMVQDLRRRLTNYRPSMPTLPHVGFEYGFNTREIPSWLHYWANDYPFDQRQDFLNMYPQFKTNIQGLDIHFIRVIPRVPPGVEVVPLLLMHGWPGSVREFYETMPYLSAVSPDRSFALEVIAPSLPGFGFSDSAVRPGLNTENMAVVLRNLMHRLGHKKFYLQGGDWGGLIGANIATLYPMEVLGFHTNYAITLNFKGLLLEGIGALFPSLVVKPALAERMYPLIEKLLFLLRESGYLHLQATKPDTVGISLSDSPAGLLAYILQIFSSGTRGSYYISREDGGLQHYPKETLIDNVMMYWASNSIATSFRIYIESLNKQFSLNGLFSKTTRVPMWALQARWEVAYQSPTILKTKYPNLIHTTVLNDGGHFLALEMPQLFAQDVLNAVEAFRKWHRKNKV